MRIKLFEIRDKATCIAAIAIDLSPGDYTQLMFYRRAGYGLDREAPILLTKIGGGHPAHSDPYAWNDRTWQTAHIYITEKFRTLPSGSVIDVEFILNETKIPKISEIIPPRSNLEP